MIKGASSENDALKKFGEDEGRFVRRITSRFILGGSINEKSRLWIGVMGKQV